jgi:hypothetical protein
MRRREVLAVLGVAAWPRAARAQQHPPMGVPEGGSHFPVIGFLYAVLVLLSHKAARAGARGHRLRGLMIRSM